MNDRAVPLLTEEVLQQAPAGGLLDLARQQRNLLLLRPLFQLELHKLKVADIGGQESTLFQGLDTHYLALCALDRMMEGTTVSTGCTREEILGHLAEVARAMKPMLGKQQLQKVADVVLGALDNRANQYREFAFEYFDAVAGSMRAVKFKLVLHEPDIEDVYRYKPTPDGYLVYLGMLDLSTEDYQELMEKMLELLVQRGRFDAALEIARRARTLSIEYRQVIRDRLHQAYRAPGTVDWRRDMSGSLDKARDHVRQRQSEDQRMEESVRDALRMAEDLKSRVNLAQLLQTLRSASTLRAQLVVDISAAADKFLQAQRSLFRARRATGLPDLESTLLPQLISLPGQVLSDEADSFIGTLYPGTWPKVLDLNTMFGLLLEQRPDDAAAEEEEGELVPLERPVDQFTPELTKQVADWLEKEFSTEHDVTVSQLMARAESDGLDVIARRCLVFTVFRSFSRAESQFPDRTAKALSDSFDADIARGTDLLFSPKGGHL